MPDTGNLAPTPGVGSTLTDFAEMIRLLARHDLHTMMPGEVIAYHAPEGSPPNRTPALVDVRPHFLYRRRIENPDDIQDGETLIERTDGWHAQGSYPDLVSVPVAYAGHDGMRSSGPIQVGAVGQLHFAERSIDEWINTGGPVDPAFDFQWHHLSDAIFVPGARYGTIAEDIDPGIDRVGSADGGAGMEISTGPAGTRTLTVSTQGPTVTLDAAQAIKLGEAAVLGVARFTDDVSASPEMAAYMAAVVVALNALAAAIPAAIVAPVPPTVVGQISEASAKSFSE